LLPLVALADQRPRNVRIGTPEGLAVAAASPPLDGTVEELGVEGWPIAWGPDGIVLRRRDPDRGDPGPREGDQRRVPLTVIAGSVEHMFDGVERLGQSAPCG
jgi:hypothetical protein